MIKNEKWLTPEKVSKASISAYRQSVLSNCPNHVVIDGLFDAAKLNDVIDILQQPQNWKIQQHTYSALYVDQDTWQQTCEEERFVQRDSWKTNKEIEKTRTSESLSAEETAQLFLVYLRSNEFMEVLSDIFNTTITDMNVGEPEVNTNYFRLGQNDFVEQHADDSPGREVCMLLYLNKDWQEHSGGELVFIGENEKHISIAPLFNRCVLFDPSSKGSEHWVNRLKSQSADSQHSSKYRYNITSWYWSE